MGYRLPPLNTLRIFEAAGRLLSFKAASEELHVTPSAVSHAIQSLEDWLGVTLFARGSKGLALTQAGRSYLGYVSEAIALLARGTQGLPGFAPRNELSISCAPTFAARWLIPNLKSFQEAYPAVSVSIDTAHRRVAFPGDDVDVAIRRGEGPWPGLFAVPLAQETLFPVVSPAYFDAHGPIRSIDDFARLTIARELDYRGLAELVRPGDIDAGGSQKRASLRCYPFGARCGRSGTGGCAGKAPTDRRGHCLGTARQGHGAGNFRHHEVLAGLFTGVVGVAGGGLFPVLDRAATARSRAEGIWSSEMKCRV